jgi:predicted nucleotidyltransferase
VLVEFEPDFVPGLEFFSLESHLSEILGRKVDLNWNFRFDLFSPTD